MTKFGLFVIMFIVNKTKRFTSITASIIQHVELPDLLNKTYKTTEISICPTQAISVVDNAIDNSRCIACGICRKLFPDAINYSPEKGDQHKFIDYCASHKMYVYKWLCLSSGNLSAMEISIKGFSRNKRVPLVSLVERRLMFVKCATSVGEIEKTIAELDDMVNLAANMINASVIQRGIVLIQKPSNQREIDYLSTLNGYTISELFDLHNNFLISMI